MGMPRPSRSCNHASAICQAEHSGVLEVGCGGTKRVIALRHEFLSELFGDFDTKANHLDRHMPLLRHSA
jgi:hypothetical protein